MLVQYAHIIILFTVIGVNSDQICQIFISHLYPELQGIHIYLLISEKEINVTDSIITNQFKQFKYRANPNCILVRTLIKLYL